MHANEMENAYKGQNGHRGVRLRKKKKTKEEKNNANEIIQNEEENKVK